MAFVRLLVFTRVGESVRVVISLCVVLALPLMSACGGAGVNPAPTAKAKDNTPAENKQIARRLIREEYARWDNATQFQCLEKLWHAESHWNHRARNKRTGACGIPQSYPCNKMKDWGKVYGVDYRTNPWPQIAWGLQYIDRRYGTPCRAWARFKRGGGY